MYRSVQHSDFCHTEGKFPCDEWNYTCFTSGDICVYRLNKLQLLFPCMFGSHLEHCAEFECNMMVKCLKSYCVPWSYVCDGKWDCPVGYDEYNVETCSATITMTIVTLVLHESVPVRLCLPFVKGIHSFVLSKIATITVSVFQAFVFFSSSFLHYKLVQEVRHSRRDATKSSETSDTPISVQLFLVSLSNFLCWFSSNAVFISVMILPQCPVAMVFGQLLFSCL